MALVHKGKIQNPTGNALIHSKFLLDIKIHQRTLKFLL